MQEICSHSLTSTYVAHQKKPQKKALHPVLLPVSVSFCSVSLSLIHTVTAAVVTFPLKPGFSCLALAWLVEASVGPGSWPW